MLLESLNIPLSNYKLVLKGSIISTSHRKLLTFYRDRLTVLDFIRKSFTFSGICYCHTLFLFHKAKKKKKKKVCLMNSCTYKYVDSLLPHSATCRAQFLTFFFFFLVAREKNEKKKLAAKRPKKKKNPL